MDKRKMMFLVALMLVSFSVIFYKFNQVPFGLTHDETEFARLALSLFREPITPYSPFATRHATLYFYTILTSFLIFGINTFALRFPAALAGFLVPIVLFYVFNEIFMFVKKSSEFTKIIHPELLSFILSILLVTQKWYINFARFSFEATFLLLLELLSLYFLVRWLQTNNASDALGTG